MDRRNNAAPSPHRAVIRCQDPVLRRLLEIELGLCGVAAVSEEEAYGLMLLDLDEYPHLPPLDGGCRLICWSHSHTAEDAAPFAGIDTTKQDILFLHRPFALSELETCIYRLILPNTAEADVRPIPVFPFPSLPEERVKKPEEAKDMVLLGNGLLSLNDQEICLTPREEALFTCLWEKRGETVSKALLQKALCASCEDGTSVGNILEVYVCHLRRKLERPSGKRLITTVRGRGYRLEAFDP